MDYLECPDPHKYITDLRDKLADLDATALKLINQQFCKNKAALERGRLNLRAQRRGKRISVGDLVLGLDDTSGSLSAQARGPYGVIGLKGHSALLQTQDTNFKDSQSFQRHLSRLAVYFDKHGLRS